MCQHLSPTHWSAFASKAGIVLGQVKTSEKSNEITTIPELLKRLDVHAAIVTFYLVYFHIDSVFRTPRHWLQTIRR